MRTLSLSVSPSLCVFVCNDMRWCYQILTQCPRVKEQHTGDRRKDNRGGEGWTQLIGQAYSNVSRFMELHNHATSFYNIFQIKFIFFLHKKIQSVIKISHTLKMQKYKDVLFFF